MSLSRKRKKELRRLQKDAAELWSSQQDLAGRAAGVAREAGRQLDSLRREQVVPVVQDVYSRRVQPVVNRGVKFASDVVDHQVVPAVGTVVGTALKMWDAADAKRRGVPIQQLRVVEKKGMGAGSVIAIILGAAAAIGVLVAAWQALRTDDELWVADEPPAPVESAE